MDCLLFFSQLCPVAVTVLTSFYVDGPLLLLPQRCINVLLSVVDLSLYRHCLPPLFHVGMMWSGGLLEWESVPERVPGKRSDSGMVMRVTWVIFGGMVFRAIVLSLYAQFDVYETGDEMGVFLLVGEVCGRW